MNLGFRELEKIKGAIEEMVPGLKIFFFNPFLVVSERQLRNALYKAMNSFRKGRNISRTLELEFICYLTGEKQIKKAKEKNEKVNRLIGLMLVSKRKKKIKKALSILRKHFHGKINLNLEFPVADLNMVMEEHGLSEGEKKYVYLADKEVNKGLEKLLLEKTALLDLKKWRG